MLLATLALAALTTPQEEEPKHVYRVEEVELTIDLSDLKSVKEQTLDPERRNQQLKRSWSAKFGSQALNIEAHVFKNRRMGFAQPEDVFRLLEGHRSRVLKRDKRSATKDITWKFEQRHYLSGEYGYFPYALVGVKLEKSETPTHFYCMAGVNQTLSYTIEIDTSSPLNEEEHSALLEFLRTKVHYSGERQVKKWTEDEIVKRWKKDGPKDLQDDLEFFRTEHFLILTNSSSKRQFGKKLEESYEAIRETFPFEEREELRLLPIFLFRTPDGYYDFCVKTLRWTKGQAKASKGVAWKDFYATWYEAPKDPVHIHEVTHQLFKNRLHLAGGGSWFQEGVAEYMSSTPNERKDFRRLVKSEKQVPLAKFFRVSSLLGSNPDERKDGSDPAHEAYLQASCIIEFAREAKGFKDKFQEFVHTVGAVPRGDMQRIEAALREVYGFGLEEFEKAFLKYWKKR